MTNLSVSPQLDDKNLLVPLKNFGLKVMSMGFLMDEHSPLIWRGLMVMQGIQRLLRGVAWGPLDYLVVDTPPGTGDTHLSLVQNIPIDGVVMVTTPQDVAVSDVRKAIEMFRKVDVPVIGLVQNMSYLICEECRHKHFIFGRGSVSKLSEETDCPLLVELPFESELVRTSDEGKPIVLAAPDSQVSKEFYKLAQKTLIFCDSENNLERI